MKSILFTYRLSNDDRTQKAAVLEEMGYKAYFENESKIEYKPYMKDIEVIVGYKFFENLDISLLPSLKWIQLTSMGFEQVPQDKVTHRGIQVTNNRGGYSIPMGEWVVLNILELAKNRRAAYQSQLDKQWYVDFSVTEIYKKKVAFIGTGDIAKEAAKRLQGFGAKIMGVNTNGRDIAGFDQCFPLSQLEQVLAQSDIVVICLPHTDETKHVFNKSILEQMKKDACLINISRGAIIKEQDLIKHLEEGNLKGVALDVFETEPLPPESKLWEFDRVVITSHNSWISEEIEQRRWDLIIENLKRYQANEELLNIVEIDKGY